MQQKILLVGFPRTLGFLTMFHVCSEFFTLYEYIAVELLHFIFLAGFGCLSHAVARMILVVGMWKLMAGIEKEKLFHHKDIGMGLKFIKNLKS